MSDDRNDDYINDDYINNGNEGDINDSDLHFSDEELQAALDGFEKEFQNDTTSADVTSADVTSADMPSAVTSSADTADNSAAKSPAQPSSDAADPGMTFDDELEGLLGNKAKCAVLITRLASSELLAAFCQLSDISADCIGSAQGAVAILRNLDGDGPESAARDLTIVVSGLSLVLAVNRADKLESTVYLQGKPGEQLAPPLLFSSTAPFVEDLLLGITDENALIGQGMKVSRSADLDHDQAMTVIAQHTRFGRGSSSID